MSGRGEPADPGPTSPESPWPVRTVARKVAEWINRLGAVWVEGQLTQITVRPRSTTAFLTLRDPAAAISLTLTCHSGMITGTKPRLAEGARVVVHGKPTFYTGRGAFSLAVDEIRPVGVGALLARIEQLRGKLASEGLFDPARKRKPPLLPRKVGLITGRASAAERDVMTNARARWPAVRFEVRTVAVQGALATSQVLQALAELDAEPDVEVIVIARGGGSVEDLLPFSEETLCRAVAAAGTPVLSAIGHEQDGPLLDHVADVRCSTPTDAGKRVVPDVSVEAANVDALRRRARRALSGWVDGQRRLLDALRSRPVLADPLAPIDARADQVGLLRDRTRRALSMRLDTEDTKLTATRSRLATLGPAATLARGYAVVQRVTGSGVVDGVVRSASELTVGTELRVRLTDDAVHATVSRSTTGEGR